MITHLDHVTRVCTYHALTPPDVGWSPNPDWARRWLATCQRNGLVTAREANAIRAECGWRLVVIQERFEL